MKKQKVCLECLGTGKIKAPLDEKIYDEAYDKLDDSGLSPEKIRDLAMEKSGYQWVDCPNCK